MHLGLRHSATRRRVLATGVAALLVPRPAWPQARPHRLAYMIGNGQLADVRIGGAPTHSALLEELQRRGYIEGENLAVERSQVLGRTDVDAYVRTVIESAPDVIFTNQEVILSIPLARMTKTIPVVCGLPDDLAAVGIANPRRPGGNITGSVTARESGGMIAKKVQLLREAVPAARRLGYLQVSADAERDLPLVHAAATAVGMVVVPLIIDARGMATEAQVRAAFEPALDFDVLMIGVSSFLNGPGVGPALVELQVARRLPAMAGAGNEQAGTLLKYTVDPEDNVERFRQMGGYVARILAGEKPGDLPIIYATRFALTVNLTTAKAIDLTLPESIFAQATTVIEE